MNRNNNSNHGGKRVGSGRKRRYLEPTVPVRVPSSLKEGVVKLCEYYKENRLEISKPIGAIEVTETLKEISAPLYSSRIPAGFPSPADDYVERRLDLNEYFINSPSSTFFLKAIGDSMNLAGIFDNTILQVDRSLEARNGDIVVAAIDGEFTVKRYVKGRGGGILLCPESDNPKYKPISCDKGLEVRIFGVVNGIHQKLR